MKTKRTNYSNYDNKEFFNFKECSVKYLLKNFNICKKSCPISNPTIFFKF